MQPNIKVRFVGGSRDGQSLRIPAEELEKQLVDDDHDGFVLRFTDELRDGFTFTSFYTLPPDAIFAECEVVASHFLVAPIDDTNTSDGKYSFEYFGGELNGQRGIVCEADFVEERWKVARAGFYSAIEISPREVAFLYRGHKIAEDRIEQINSQLNGESDSYEN